MRVNAYCGICNEWGKHDEIINGRTVKLIMCDYCKSEVPGWYDSLKTFMEEKEVD